jgi:hypothetical protein
MEIFKLTERQGKLYVVSKKDLSYITSHVESVKKYLSDVYGKEVIVQIPITKSVSVESVKKIAFLTGIHIDRKNGKTYLMGRYTRNESTDPEKVYIISSVIENFKNGVFDSDVCKSCRMNFRISKKTLLKLRRMVHKSGYKEFTGHFTVRSVEFSPKLTTVLEVKDNHIEGGDNEEVDGNDLPFTFHTHPIEAYKERDVKYAWPSRTDYRTIYELLISLSGIFHLVATVEGIYIVSLKDKESCKIDKLRKSPKKIIHSMVERILHPERDFSPKLYVKKIRNKKDNPFEVQYFDWKTASSVFSVQTPRITKGDSMSCKL